MDGIELLIHASHFTNEKSLIMVYHNAIEKCRKTNGHGTQECFNNILYLRYIEYLMNKYK